jgi:hypothetical protein
MNLIFNIERNETISGAGATSSIQYYHRQITKCKYEFIKFGKCIIVQNLSIKITRVGAGAIRTGAIRPGAIETGLPFVLALPPPKL